MGDFITSSQTSLATLKDQCQLLYNILHDTLMLEVGPDRLDPVRDLATRARVDNCTRSAECIICCSYAPVGHLEAHRNVLALASGIASAYRVSVLPDEYAYATR